MNFLGYSDIMDFFYNYKVMLLWYIKGVIRGSNLLYYIRLCFFNFNVFVLIMFQGVGDKNVIVCDKELWGILVLNGIDRDQVYVWIR